MNIINKTMYKNLKYFGFALGIILIIIFTFWFLFMILPDYMSANKAGVENPVYDTEKTWTFRVGFYDSENRLTRKDTIQLTTFNKRFLIAQNKITWTLNKGNTIIEESTGIVEKKDRIWLHPPRFNHNYTDFTEYSAFPEINWPVEVGKKWKSGLYLGSFATEESGSELNVIYVVKQIDTIKSEPLNRQITILGQGTSGLGVYENLMIFDDSLGFIKMTYTKANQEKLIIELIEKSERE